MWAFCRRGIALQYLANYEAAETSFASAITEQPGHHAPYYLRGKLFEALSKDQEACSDFQKAVECDPVNEPSKAALSVLRRKFGFGPELPLDRSLEISQLSKSISEDSTMSMKADQYRLRGDAYSKAQEYALAIEDYTKAMSLDPSLDWLLTRRAFCRMSSNDYAGAIRDCDESIRMHKSGYYRAWDLCHKAWAFERQGNASEALQCYNEAVEHAPGESSIKWGRAALLETMGMLEQSLNDFMEVLAMAPGTKLAQEQCDRVRAKLFKN